MTLKQRLLFTLFLCTGMAGSMSWLGMAKSMGINGEMWRLFWLSIGPMIAFAFVFNLLVVSNLSNLLIKWRTRRLTDSAVIRLKAATIRSWTMLLSMCFTMSTLALTVNGTLFHMTVAQFILGFFGTLTMAYFIRDLVIMPLATRLVFQIMPV
ncbi:hypothetical protein C5Z25_08840 [Lactobacillus sp. CBA3605]|uniref:hypothetical protein n=1 Tax=Lactobacillus sp. CBA3605 TaxID=2099788 RepID=UPI000CFC4891|nr:hypothetical protein [Lactobacillus sp. CBA3605]AVK61869.1 hypothetical protein C5Z25_08840 [Lactobacillus sp. CBA3605]